MGPRAPLEGLVEAVQRVHRAFDDLRSHFGQSRGQARLQFVPGEWPHADEREPPAKGGIQGSDRPIGAVHRPEQVEVVGNPEQIVGVGQLGRHAARPAVFMDLVRPGARRIVTKSLRRLQPEEKVAEHLRDVRAVDLVDEDEEVSVGLGSRCRDPAAEHPGPQLEAPSLAVRVLRIGRSGVVPDPFDELLVARVRVEGDGPGAVAFSRFAIVVRADESWPSARDRCDRVRLAGTGRSLKDDVLEDLESGDGLIRCNHSRPSPCSTRTCSKAI